MDPDMFDIFAPRPGMDPFALGRLMSTNPEALAPMLGQVAPPPKEGQGFGDWITEQQGGYGPHVQPQGPAQSALAAAPDAPGAGGQGTPMFPPMTQTPGQPPTAGGVTGDVSRLLTTAFPGPPGTSAGYMPTGQGGGTPGEISQPGIPGMDFLAGPTPIQPDLSRSPMPPVNYGPEFNEAFGSVPGAPTPPPAGGSEALPYTRRTVPDRLAPLTGGTDERGASAEAPGKPANAQAANAALGRLGSSLAGLKAPPTPGAPSLETPRGVGGQPTKAGGNIAQLIAALMGGGGGAGGAGVPLRLGPALYGGGRGLY